LSKETGSVYVSVVMPAYNEEEHIESCFNKVAETLEAYGQPFEIILEEDGSTDRTPEIISELARKHNYVKALHFPKRMGKGFGIKRCFEVAKGKYIVLIDSDLEYPPEQIPKLLRKINGAAMVIGVRNFNEKHPERTLLRSITSRVYCSIIKSLFKINGLHDPQAGFKVFKREMLERISPLVCNGFEIDTEILIKAMMCGFTVNYVPIVYTYKGNSKVNLLGDPLKMFFSLLKWKANKKMLSIEAPLQCRTTKAGGQQ
jgi:glycosyltransferase involved in cell wall biosynthesis